MSNTPLHVGDYGTVFNLTIQDQDDEVVNLTGSSGNLITFLKPDKVTFVRSGVIANASTGLLQYTLASGELMNPGIWSIQAQIINPSGTWYSNVQEFRVETNI